MTNIAVKIANTEQVEILTSAPYRPDPFLNIKGTTFPFRSPISPTGVLKALKASN